MLNIFKSKKYLLGFDDRWMILLGIPFISLLVNTLLFGHLIQQKAYGIFTSCYPISLYFTALYWFTFRELYFYVVKKYPLNSDFKKRQSVTLITIIVGYFVIDFLGGLFLHVVLDFQLDNNIEPNRVLKLITSVLFSILIVTIYESFYLSSQLGKSLIEKEQLYKENISSQLSALRNHINPHFLFNSLNTLSSLIHEDQKRADNFVTKLSKVYRHMLDNTSDILVSLQDELTYLHAYIHLLKERFGDNLIYVEDIDARLLKKKIIPLSLQITFENCVKHNIATAEKPLTVTIKSSQDGLYLYVTNNVQLMPVDDTTTSVGLKNIIKRYSYFTAMDIKIRKDDNIFEVGLPLLDENTSLNSKI
jgi:two-component system, LytTR family, sensor kinase